MPRLFGTNGIRGIVGRDMVPELAVKVGLVAGTFFKGGTVFVGYDGRLSSPMLKNAIISGLMATGCKVYDIGMAPTPVIQYSIRHYRPDGGIIITASHNPPEYNGIKTLASDGVETSREEELVIEDIYFNECFDMAPWNALGELHERPGIIELYKEAVKKHVDVEAVRGRKFRVVVDPGNGVGALVYLDLLREVGCEVIEINSFVDGSFPSRLPEPTPERLTDLSHKVVETNADLGVAYDGDGDRALFCDEKGVVHWGDKSAAILMKHVLRDKRGEKVVTPISSSKLVEDIAGQCGATIIFTKVGSIDVSHKMKEVGSIYGCEENGGCFYAPHQPVRDGGMTTLLMLEALLETGKALSQLVEELPKYYLAKGRVPCPDELKEEALQALLRRTEGYERVTIDGVKLILPEGRVLIRPSWTEPIFRIYVDASTPEEAKRLSEWATRLTEDAIGKCQRGS